MYNKNKSSTNVSSSLTQENKNNNVNETATSKVTATSPSAVENKNVNRKKSNSNITVNISNNTKYNNTNSITTNTSKNDTNNNKTNISSTTNSNIKTNYTSNVAKRSTTTTTTSTKANTNTMNVVTKSNKAQEKMNKLKSMGKSMLTCAPKKECTICHKFIESHLHQIHVNNHPSQIFKWMYLGTFETACNPSDLRRLKINYVLNCAYDCKNTNLSKGVTELHLKVKDDIDFEIFDYFEQANKFINNVRNHGGVILVHCKLGVSRSPSFVAAYLMKYFNFSLDSALKFIRKSRPQVKPNEGFMNYLQKYEQALKNNGGKKD
jgi:protein-tyrosine phosphatase